MKVYSISKWAFGAICLLILLLPVSRHWKLLTTGEKAPGIVSGFVLHKEEKLVGESEVTYASVISFEADGILHKAYGPNNYEYKPGRKIVVFYDSQDPSHNCIATFSGFYLDNYTVLPIILLVFWAAFYLSFNNYRRKQRFKKVSYKGAEDMQDSPEGGAGTAIGGPIQAARRLTGSKGLFSKK